MTSAKLPDALQPLLLQHLPVGVIVHAPDARILFANDHAVRFLELSQDQRTSVGTSPEWSFVREDETAMPPDERPLNRVLAGRQPFHDLVVGIDRQVAGDRLWMLAGAFPEFAADGTLRCVVITFADITARKKAEARQHHLTEVLRAIRNVNQLITHEKDRDRLVHQACDLLTETRGYHAAWIALCDADGRLHAAHASDVGMAFETLRAQFAQGLWPACCREALNQSEVVVRRNSAVDCPSCPLAHAHAGAAALTAALRHNGRDYGVLVVALPGQTADDGEERALFKEVVGDLGFALHALEGEQARARAEAAMRTNKAKLESALASMTDAVFISDADGRFVDFNEAFATFHRFPNKDECARTLAEYPAFLDVFLADGRPAPLEQWAVPRALRGETGTNAEYSLRRKDTGESWIGSYSFAPIRDRDGVIVGSVVVGRDITAQKRAEQQLLESRATHRSLYMNILNSVVHARIIFDGDVPVDMEYISTNPAFAAITGITEPVAGRRISEVIPGYATNSPESLEVFGRVAVTGEPMRWEHHLRSLNRWFAFMIYSPARGEVVIISENITERKRAETALRESEERFRALIDGAPDAIFVQSGGRFQFLNPAAVRLFGATRSKDLAGMSSSDRIAPEYLEAVHARIRSQTETGAPVPPMEQIFLRLDGSRVPVETAAVPCRFEGDAAHLVFVRDITARRKADADRMNLEAQLQQAQKMESVGRLAGGVAHDFNNLLMGIMNCAELCRDELAADHPVRHWLDEITADAERSVAITRQLLAFARKQTIAPTVLDLNDHVSSMLKLLRRLIGEDIDLAWLPGARPAMVKMDPSQVDQVLANLAVNARDAISSVGAISIETGEATFDETYCTEHAGFVPGIYVMLAVSDTGCGMDKSVLDHLFEPFFTTKGVGQGTGLGLATVYGITRQNNGFINVYSEPGKGTTFRIYLPRHVVALPQQPAAATKAKYRGGTETILLVEDERSVRVTTCAFLKTLGYTVLDAEAPKQALERVAGYAETIHLLVTDVVLPGMSGRDLANQLSKLRPSVRCVFMSGYTANVIAHRGVLDEGVDFLCKPFCREDLALKVREVLDRTPVR